MIGIYKIWFVGKENYIYVGQTLNNFNTRKRNHLNSLKRNKHDNDYLQKVFNKYGEKEFNFEPIEYFLNKNVIYAVERETYWYYKFLNQGINLYNFMPPIEHPAFSKEIREKLSILNKGQENPFYGKKHTQETKEKMSKARLGKYAGKNNSMYGTTHSQKSKLLMSVKKGAKPFYILKNNQVIGEFCNKAECARKLNLIRRGIGMCLQGTRKTHKGYTFQYVNN